jgi:hypothetical protein
MRAQSSVPLFSGIEYQGSYIVGILWGLVQQIFLGIFDIALDIFQWLLLTMFFGFLLHYIYFVWKRFRFRNPLENPELTDLFHSVTIMLGKGENVELWYRDIDRSVFLSTVNPLFQAILLSESAIADILEKKEKAKIVLAREVLVMTRTNSHFRLLLGVLVFTLFTFLENFFSFTSFGPIIFSAGPLILTAMLITFFIAAIIIMVHRIRKEGDIDKSVEEMLGYPPDAAMIDVFSGFTIPEQELLKIKKDEEEGKPSEPLKAVRRGIVAGVLSFPLSFIIFYFLVLGFSSLRLIFSLALSSVVTFAAFVLTSMLSMMWKVIQPGPRSTEWDIQVPFANEIQAFLRQFKELGNIDVRGIKSPSDEMYGLIILRLNKNYEEEVLDSMFPRTLKDIHEVELAGPLILSELRRKEIEKRSNRLGYGVVVVMILSMVLSFIIPIMLFGFTMFLFVLAPLLIVAQFLFFVPLGYFSYKKRKDEIMSDVEIATSCPRFREALQILIDNHHTQPYGITSYRTRLDRIDKHLGIQNETGNPLFE